jgi:hypothetical protein
MQMADSNMQKIWVDVLITGQTVPVSLSSVT